MSTHATYMPLHPNCCTPSHTCPPAPQGGEDVDAAAEAAAAAGPPTTEQLAAAEAAVAEQGALIRWAQALLYLQPVAAASA